MALLSAKNYSLVVYLVIKSIIKSMIFSGFF